MRALRINGVNHLVLNKMDVLKEVDEWHLISNGDEISFETQEQMKEFISDSLSDLPQLEGIHFSSSKERI